VAAPEGAPEAPRRKRSRTASTLAAELSAEIDGAIEASFDDGDSPSDGAMVEDRATEEEIRRLFGQIAAHHVASVRDFAIQLRRGPTGKSWARMCAPAVASLERAAAGIGHDELGGALNRFAQALERGEKHQGTEVNGVPRQELLARFDDLVRVLPEAFDLAAHMSRREPILLDALVAAVPGVGRLDIERLGEAGVMQLDTIVRATASELAVVSGVPTSKCAAIVDAVRKYQKQRAEQAPDAQRQQERLRALLDALAQERGRFVTADEADDRAAKRSIRRTLGIQLRQLDILLAELGEVELVEELRPMPVERKIERVDRFLREPKATLVPARADT
jgi:hypothetical protein